MNLGVFQTCLTIFSSADKNRPIFLWQTMDFCRSTTTYGLLDYQQEMTIPPKLHISIRHLCNFRGLLAPTKHSALEYEKANEHSRREVVFELRLQHSSQLVCWDDLLQCCRLIYTQTLIHCSTQWGRSFSLPTETSADSCLTLQGEQHQRGLFLFNHLPQFWYSTPVLSHCWLGGTKGIEPVKKWGVGGGGHCLVQMEWRPAGWSVCLPLLIFPCTIKSRSFLAPAHLGGPGKRAVKWLWCGGDIQLHKSTQRYERHLDTQVGSTYDHKYNKWSK